MNNDASETIFITNRKGHTNVGDVPELVEEFRLYYLDERRSGRTDQMQIFREFRKNKEFEDIWFNPYRNMVEGYFKKWEQSLPFQIKKIPPKNKDTKNKKAKEALLKEVGYHDLEAGAKTLQDLLITDANKLVVESNKAYDGIDEEGGYMTRTDYEKLRLAKKKLALAVSEKIMAGAHRSQVIGLKKNAEGRQNAGFLMDLVRRSAAGEVSDREMEVLEGAVL